MSLIGEFTERIDRSTYETRYHGYRATCLSLRIGDHMGLKPRELFTLGAAPSLHDIGKLRISREILLKRGGMNDEELGFMRLRLELCGNILKRFLAPRRTGSCLPEHGTPERVRIPPRGFPWTESSGKPGSLPLPTVTIF